MEKTFYNEDMSTGITLFIIIIIFRGDELIFKVNVNYFVFWNSSSKMTQKDYQLCFLV